jgi:hypothetical protein
MWFEYTLGVDAESGLEFLLAELAAQAIAAASTASAPMRMSCPRSP